jgi:hypothetical protein
MQTGSFDARSLLEVLSGLRRDRLLLLFRQYEFFIRKTLPRGNFIPYLTQIDIKKEIFINQY